MGVITNIKIASLNPKGLVATAASGTYLKASGHPCQVIVENPANESGKALKVNNQYVIAAQGMYTTMNMVLDHINKEPSDGVLYVFFELLPKAKKKQ